MAESNNEGNKINTVRDNTDDIINNNEEVNRFIGAELQHEEVVVCQCVCACEAYEEVNPLAANLAPLCCCCNDSPEIAEFICTCGIDDDDHNCAAEAEAECSYHCCGCGVDVIPSDDDDEISDRRSPIPESLASDYNNGTRTPSPEPIELDGNEVSQSIHMPPAPPPLPPIANDNSRMLFRNTTMTPMTLLKVLSCEDDSSIDSRIHEAARAGNDQELGQLLEDEKLSKFLNSKIKPFMSTPLREAVAGGNKKCVKMLLSRGAEVDIVDVKGQTALFFAASSGFPEIMEVLLKHGANPEGSLYNNCTPLLLCVRDGCTEGVQVLLKYRVDPQPVSMLTTCVPGWPLQHCVVYKNYGCFLALLRGGAETSLIRVIQAKMKLDKNVHECLDAGMFHRLSITRTVLRHASESPEFLLTFREFGGVLESLENLPADMKSEDCSAMLALKHCLDNPQTLKSQCRLKLSRTFGAKNVNNLTTTTLLPGSLVDYLNFNDCCFY